jgi:transcriptional regulator with PAS, ATPase and Fis domain
MTLLELKEDLIKKALSKHNNKISKAAIEVGVCTRTIQNYITKFDKQKKGLE